MAYYRSQPGATRTGGSHHMVKLRRSPSSETALVCPPAWRNCISTNPSDIGRLSRVFASESFGRKWLKVKFVTREHFRKWAPDGRNRPQAMTSAQIALSPFESQPQRSFAACTERLWSKPPMRFRLTVRQLADGQQHTGWPVAATGAARML